MGRLLKNMSGQADAGKIKFDAVLTNIPSALLSCAFNAGGGAAVGVAREIVEKIRPGTTQLGQAVIIMMTATACKAVFVRLQDLDNMIREFASGLAGGVGAELFEAVWLWYKYDAWEAGKVYVKGNIVRHKGELWTAMDDMPAMPVAEPGKDGRWQKRAQGISMGNIAMHAQAFLATPDMLDTMSEFAAAHVAERRPDMSEEQKREMRHELKRALAAVAGELSKAA